MTDPFHTWFHEQEGSAIRAERFNVDVAELRAAFEAGQAAEREATERRIGELLKDPSAVRLNWMRGGIDASYILPDEIDIYRLLKKSGGKRGYGQIARYLAASIRGATSSEQ